MEFQELMGSLTLTQHRAAFAHFGGDPEPLREVMFDLTLAQYRAIVEAKGGAE